MGKNLRCSQSMETRKHILTRIEAFLARTGISPARFGTEAVGDHKFVKRLREGAGVTLTGIERAEAFMDAMEQAEAAPSAAAE